jgi:perosamine synthetase
MNKIPINKPSITQKEIDYVTDAITNGWGSNCYDYIYKFEDAFKQYQNNKYAVATSSCTGAIHLALLALGVEANDEVIIPEITWIASASPIMYIGAKPVFVDVLKDTWCIDPQKIEAAITSKTKAIIVAHIYGNVCEMDEIMAIAKKHNLKVLEDAAEGLGSEYKGQKCGSIGDVGVFSFHGTKTITSGEGGMLVCNDEAIYKKVRVLNDHGRNPEDTENKPYWMRNYGYKYKISNLQAALGLAQIERAQELINNKIKIFNWYKDLLKDENLELNPKSNDVINSYWMPTILLPKNKNLKREDFFEICKQNGIDSRPFFYPLSSLPMFTSVKSNTIAYDLYYRGINLPSFNDITFAEVKLVCDLLINFLN